MECCALLVLAPRVAYSSQSGLPIPEWSTTPRVVYHFQLSTAPRAVYSTAPRVVYCSQWSTAPRVVYSTSPRVVYHSQWSRAPRVVYCSQSGSPRVVYSSPTPTRQRPADFTDFILHRTLPLDCHQHCTLPTALYAVTGAVNCQLISLHTVTSTVCYQWLFLCCH